MNTRDKTHAATAQTALPTSLKLKPAARRHYLLQVMRGRIPRDPDRRKAP
jgi:hypothetical protein